MIEVSLTCRIPARPMRAVIRDVSRHGCRIEVPGAPIELGGTALLELPDAGKIAGSIVWTQGKVAGVRFDRALSGSAAVALGLEQAKPAETIAAIEYPPQPAGILRHWFRRLAGCFS